jgi:SAM-dependent methyltransferase
MEQTPCLVCRSDQTRLTFRTRAMMHAGNETFTFAECANCGLVYLNPRVPAEAIGPYYARNYLPYRGAAAWGKYHTLVEMGQRQTDRKRVTIVRRYATLTPRSRVLDLGCGKPTFLQQLHSRTGCQASGLDFKAAGWTDTPEFTALDLREGTLENVHYPHPFDAITLWHYLEHDYQPLQTLRRLKEMATPQARLFIEVPNYDSFSRRKQGVYWEGFHTPRHTAVYSPETLACLLKNSGWRVVRQFTHGTLNPYALWWMGVQERKGIDWSESMEAKFPAFLLGQIAWTPLLLLQRYLNLGIQLTIAEPA